VFAALLLPLVFPALQVQQLLALCGEHIETEEATAWKTLHQSGKPACVDAPP